MDFSNLADLKALDSRVASLRSVFCLIPTRFGLEERVWKETEEVRWDLKKKKEKTSREALSLPLFMTVSPSPFQDDII